jgi:hypothetical protein
MDVFLIDVKEVVDLLKEVDVTLSKDIIVYYIVQNLPKEYEVFKRMLPNTRQLPPYKKLESMSINEEIFLKMNILDDAKALLVQCDKFQGGYDGFRPQPNYGNNHMPNPNVYGKSYGRGQPSYFVGMHAITGCPQ